MTGVIAVEKQIIFDWEYTYIGCTFRGKLLSIAQQATFISYTYVSTITQNRYTYFVPWKILDHITVYEGTEE
jgi:hypothetical protein